MTGSLVLVETDGMSRRPAGERHPWLTGVPWFVDACDRLMAALDVGDAILIGMNQDRDRDPTARVRIDTARTQDEIDDMPGIRRIERRAVELIDHLPARPPFGAEVRVTADDVAVNLLWRHPGNAVLFTRRRPDGWHGADMIVIPARHLPVADAILAQRDPIILHAIDRLLGGGRIDTSTSILSATRRDDELRVLIGAGGVLPNIGPTTGGTPA